MVPLVDAAPLEHRAGFQHRFQALLEHPGVAAGLRDQFALQGWVNITIEPRAEQFAHRIVRQRRQSHGHARTGQSFGNGLTGRQILQAVTEDQARRCRGPRRMRQQRQRALVGPMQILDHQHRDLGCPLKEFSKGFKQAQTGNFRRQIALGWRSALKNARCDPRQLASDGVRQTLEQIAVRFIQAVN